MNFVKRYFRGKFNEIRDWNDPNREEFPMPCPEITLEGIDKGLYSKLLSGALQAGAEFDGDRVTLHGMLLEWTWDQITDTLHITPLKHPFYSSCDEISSKIRELADKAKRGGI
jgi:hypothetical protein